MQVSERGIARLFGRFWPHPMNVRRRDVVLSCLGGALGLALTEWISRLALGVSSPCLIAPMGASTVLLFGVPASPLAQPWSIVGGNLVAALIGVSVAALVPHPAVAAGLAVGFSMAVMFALRCLHPPSGAVALTAVLGGPAIQQLGFQFVLTPVLGAARQHPGRSSPPAFAGGPSAPAAGRASVQCSFAHRPRLDHA